MINQLWSRFNSSIVEIIITRRDCKEDIQGFTFHHNAHSIFELTVRFRHCALSSTPYSMLVSPHVGSVISVMLRWQLWATGRFSSSVPQVTLAWGVNNPAGDLHVWSQFPRPVSKWQGCRAGCKASWVRTRSFASFVGVEVLLQGHPIGQAYRVHQCQT